MLAASTLATYYGYVELKSGSVVILTNSGMFVQVGRLKFVAADPQALTKFEVQKNGCEVTVVARNKNVTLPDGRTLDEGRSASATDDDCACAAIPLGGHFPYAMWGVIGGGAAAAAAGVAILTRGSGAAVSVSPSRP